MNEFKKSNNFDENSLVLNYTIFCIFYVNYCNCKALFIFKIRLFCGRGEGRIVTMYQKENDFTSLIILIISVSFNKNELKNFKNNIISDVFNNI